MNSLTSSEPGGASQDLQPEVQQLFRSVVERAPREAAKMLRGYPEPFVVDMLELLNPGMALDVLECLPDARRQAVLAAASARDKSAVDAQRIVWRAHERSAHAAATRGLSARDHGGRRH